MAKEIASAAIPAAIFVLSGGTVFGLTGFQAFAAMTAVNYGLGQVAQSLAPRPALRDIEREAQDITTVSSIDSHKIIYGRTITGGTLAYSQLSSFDQDYLNLVIALAPHEIEGIQKIYVNSDEAVSLELADDVISTTVQEHYSDNQTTTVTKTGTVVAGGQINVDAYHAGDGTLSLTVAGSSVFSHAGGGVVRYETYQNTSGSDESYTLTFTPSGSGNRLYVQLLNTNYQVSSKYKDLIHFYPVYGATDDWFEFLGRDVSSVTAAGSQYSSAEGEWNNTHTMTGLANIWVRIKYDTTTLEGRVPNIACVVKGKKLYDPRDSSTAWSDNPALMIRDYLTNTDYGCGASLSEIDDTAIITSANRCDTFISTTHGTIGDNNTGGTVYDDGGKVAWKPTGSSVVDRYLPYHIGDTVRLGVSGSHAAFDKDLTIVSFSGDKKGFTTDENWAGSSEETDINVTGSIRRYTANGIADTANNRKTNLEYMVTSCAGQLFYTGGKFSLKAGEYEPPFITIDEKDMVGAISVSTRPPASQIFNSVKGFYNSRNEDFVAKDYPPYSDATGVADDEREIYVDLPLRFTTNQKVAERLASIAVKRHRLFRSVQVTCNLSVFRLQVGDSVTLNYSPISTINGTYEIMDYKINVGSPTTIQLTLQELNSSVYSV
jgi:hypothetical protein